MACKNLIDKYKYSIKCLSHQKHKMDKILLFIPCLNAEKTITSVLDRIRKLNFHYNLLIVDNNSPDDTLKKIEEYKQKNNFTNCTIIKNIRNIGYGGSQKVALGYGIHNNYDYLIVLHADGQYPIEYSDKLIQAIKNSKSALVVGSRVAFKNVKKSMPKWRYFGNKILSGFDRWAYNLKLSEFHSEFRIYDLKFMDKIDMNKWGNHDSFTLHSLLSISSNGGKIKEIPIPCLYHKDAHHPPTLNLIWYAMYTFYRGFIYKIFRR